jgi:hypothetical protein
VTERVRHTTVRFARPFSLDGHDGTFPPGDYTVEITEELLDSMTVVAYRRTRTTIALPASHMASASRQLVEIDPVDLEAALAKDAEAA